MMKQALAKFFNIGVGGKEMNPLLKRLHRFTKGYDHEKYWHRRSVVVDPSSKVFLLRKLYFLYWIKKTDGKFG